MRTKSWFSLCALFRTIAGRRDTSFGTEIMAWGVPQAAKAAGCGRSVWRMAGRTAGGVRTSPACCGKNISRSGQWKSWRSCGRSKWRCRILQPCSVSKNMVARILENRKYTGVQGWPVIIPEEQYDRANEKRTSKVTPPKKTEAQKVLNRLCRGGPAADAGQVVLQLLNNLIADQEQICTPETPKADTMQINNLSRALKQELDAALLRSAVSAVRMRRCSISILLKNGQIVERSRAL